MTLRQRNPKSEERLSIGDLATVHDLVYPALTKWYNIGLQLKLPAYALDAIERSRGDDGDHLRDTLKKWLERDAPTPTIKALVDALKSSPVGESRLACKVEDKLHSPPNSRSFNKSSHTPLHVVSSRQYNFLQWIKVICLLIFIFTLTFLVVLTLNVYSDYVNLLLRRVVYQMHLLDSKSLPFLDRKVFIGREQSKRQIIQEIYKPRQPIIAIVGPPGFGKSTLAIHIGHAIEADGFLVHYVDMSDISSKESLAVRILADDSGTVTIENVTVERLYGWARRLNERTLLILDNCDIILHNTTDLQTVIEKLLESSPRLKILMTSRKKVLQINQFTYPLGNISSEASCTLLQKVSYHEGLNSTTCKSIASLTGNVPLALQVVGAILNDAHSPDVLTIVHKLERDLIPTLSPEDLPVRKRVNASINLSYQYLTPQLQKIGRFAANFPGSFDEEAACSILISILDNSLTCSDITKYLEDLVKRSLLEFDRRRNRYQFHTLIREFFLAVSQEATEGRETNDFMIHFQSFYTSVLQTLTKQFNDNYVQALTNLDIERQNILRLLEYLGDPNLMMDDTSDLLDAVRAVQFSFEKSFLKCRFTSRELIGPVSRIVERLSQKLNLLLKHPISVKYFKYHVVMMIYLADLKATESTNISEAVQVFTSEKHIVVSIEQEQSTKVSDSLWLFYSKLTYYYGQLQEHEKVKECQEKVATLSEDIVAKCEESACQYEDIDLTFYSMGTHVHTACLFMRALDSEGENLTVMAKTLLLTHLYTSAYSHKNCTEVAKDILKNLTALLPDVMAQPASELYSGICFLKTLVSIYSKNGKCDEARQLTTRLIKAEQQVGAKPTEDTIQIARELVYYFLEAKDYAQVADLAEFVLQSRKHSSYCITNDQCKKEVTEAQLAVGIAKFMSGNFSGLDYMNLAADYTCENALWTDPTFTLSQIIILALHGHLCPLLNIIQKHILSYPVWILGELFQMLFWTHKNLFILRFTAYLRLYNMVTEKSDLYINLLPFSVSVYVLADLDELVLSNASAAAFLKLSGIVICLYVLNVIYVMEKLFLVSCLVYFLWRCIASMIDYCRVFLNFVFHIVIICTVQKCPSYFISASCSFIPWLLLCMFDCLSFITIIRLKIIALLYYVVGVINLMSVYFLCYCIISSKLVHYYNVFVYLLRQFIITFQVFILPSILQLCHLVLLGGIAYGVFKVNLGYYSSAKVIILSIIFVFHLITWTILWFFHLL